MPGAARGSAGCMGQDEPRRLRLNSPTTGAESKKRGGASKGEGKWRQLGFEMQGVLGAPGVMGDEGAPVTLAVCIGWEGADVPHGTGKCRASPRAALGRAQPAARQVAGTCCGVRAGVSPPP